MKVEQFEMMYGWNDFKGKLIDHKGEEWMRNYLNKQHLWTHQSKSCSNNTLGDTDYIQANYLTTVT